nr:immunoglobulin heavy chain junction region [Macaca mulatta]
CAKKELPVTPFDQW